ncbi:TPA: hypothetical protein ACGBUC_000569 [Klebsiella variicola]|uniref:hypothetical protein n=1 Tax=Klebsiella variicola TaxID=244366 RepID=UPI0006BDC64C|nr:hypothetical protein [Klebsiella variicola]BAS34824.1 putative uncharacterized protein [Klebsiella pneumoniae]VGP69887.1 hypothetical protein SB5387_00916 [Klebsiella variicola]HCI9589923.1 hypothetical protein [Klebsiella variicola]
MRLPAGANAGIKIIDGDNSAAKMAIKNTPFVRYSTITVRLVGNPKIKLML